MPKTGEMIRTLADGPLIEGKYRIRSTLGRGSMGVVFLADDLALERLVAIKLVAPTKDSKQRDIFRQWFRREATAMAQIRHPNVAQVHSFGEHEGYPFIVMEYVPGERLSDFIARQSATGLFLPIDVALGVLHQICAGLDEVHRAGLVHRDIKPANVIIGPQYRVCIVDFGVSQPRDDGVELVGTPPYIAPEVLDGQQVEPALRHHADIYALGVCGFELLTGRQPFVLPDDARTLQDLVELQLTEPPLRISALRGDLPPAFEAYFDRVLARDPRRRYASCQALCRDLQQARERVLSQQAPRRRVLVVDDDDDIRELYKAVIEVAIPRAELHGATDGLVALELAKARRPDLIVLDLNMPRINGLELCGILQGTDGLSDVPLIVISAALDAETRGVLADLGVTQALTKPVPPRELAALVKHHLA